MSTPGTSDVIDQMMEKIDSMTFEELDQLMLELLIASALGLINEQDAELIALAVLTSGIQRMNAQEQAKLAVTN